MTRQGFRILASFLARHKPDPLNPHTEVGFLFWMELVIGLTNELASRYPKFNRERFLKACGVENSEIQP